MALALTVVHQSTSANAFGTGAYTAASFTPTASRRLLVLAQFIESSDGGAEGSNLTISCSTGGITSFTVAATSANAPAGWSFGSRAWISNQTTSGSAVTDLAVDCGTASVENYRLTVWEVTDYGSIGATASGTDADGDGALALTLGAAPASTSIVVAAVQVALSSVPGSSVTPNAAWTEVEDTSRSDWYIFQIQTRGSSTSTSVDWSDINDVGILASGATAMAFEIVEGASGTPVGRADETDTAFALTFAPFVGRANETDSAFALTPTNFAEAGDLFIFGDTDSIESSMGGLRVLGGEPTTSGGTSINVGRADETDTSLARSITLATGLAAETDTSLARTLTQSRAVGLSTETATALALTPSQARAVGRSDETDTAIARGATLATGRADEIGTALALDLNAGLSVGTAAETDTALARGITRATGRADETSTAQALNASQARTTGLASETDTALGPTASQSRAAGRADEADTALALTLSGPVAIDVGRADEVDTARPLDLFVPAPVQGPGTFQEFAAAGGLAKKTPAKREPKLRAPKVAKAPKAPKIEEAPKRAAVVIDCGQAIEVDEAFALRALERVGGLYRTPLQRTTKRSGVDERVAALENEVRALRRAVLGR